MEELCPTCPLRGRQIATLSGEEIVEVVRGRADDVVERRAILALSAGKQILKALSRPRPERCDILDRTLPGFRSRHAAKQGFSTADCPEAALGSLLQTEFPPDLPDSLQ